MNVLRESVKRRGWWVIPIYLCSGHPCSGQLSVSDVRLRLSHTIHNTEGGKRVHSVVSNTTRVVADTSKVVAGGIGAAKVSFSLLSLSIPCGVMGWIWVSTIDQISIKTPNPICRLFLKIDQ